jgi:hypothetical protein
MRHALALFPLWFAFFAAATAQEAPLKIPIEYVATACGPGFVPCLTPTYRMPTAEQRAALDAALASEYPPPTARILSIKDSNEEGSIIGGGVFPAPFGLEAFLFTPGHPILVRDASCCVVDYSSLNNNGLLVGDFAGPVLTDTLHGITIASAGPGWAIPVTYISNIVPDPRIPNETFLGHPVAPTFVPWFYARFTYINDLNQIDAYGNSGQRYILSPVSRSSKERCKNGAWQNFPNPPGPFKNQGECVSYFASVGSK